MLSFNFFSLCRTEDNKLPNTKNIKKKNPQNAAGTQPNPATGSSGASNNANNKPNLNQLQQQNNQHHLHNGSLNGNAGGLDPSGQQPTGYELSMSAMYQSGLQTGNGQMPAHLLGSAASNLSNNNSSSSSTNGPVSNELNNGLMDGHLLVEPKQEPEINSQFMQL